MNRDTNIVGIEFVCLPVINFAMQQNRVSVIRQFSIENKTNEALKDISIILSAEPEFATAAPYLIESVPAGATVRIESFRINLSSTYFAQLTERMAGNFTLKVLSGEECIFEEKYPVDILAFDQWGGLSVLPEMLSSFITPNHPAITPIIKRAATILEQWTGNASLDEYQSRNPDRVRKQMAAIYTAISELNIIYSTVPASFEEYGQRIRMADMVLTQKLGTCLDMAVLYASCLEAVGIHPFIVVTQGHAFAGGWLIPETFPDSIVDDASFLTKRTADGINEITLVETTCMNMGSNADFDQAVKTADGKLSPSSFVLALDVKRSRFTGIRPLPQRIQKGLQWEIIEEEPLTDKSQAAPESVNPYDLSGISTEVELTKQLMWERKLLDLSLRNNLLNIRVTKNTLQLIAADLDKFEDALADGGEFQIMPKPTDWDNPLYDFGIYQSLEATDPMAELIKSEISQKRLRSYLSENDLSKALVHLYRSSRLSIEENGANTLYLALGLLKWYETPSSERPRYAPILLLPVEIIRKSAAKGYVIRSREEDTMMNITLLEMLRQNFGITISGLDPLPVDESGVNVRLIYSIIRKSIKDQRKWDVEEQAILGIFSFNKFIMWNDIHNNVHKLIENKIVSSLINGKIEWNVQEDMVDAAVLDRDLAPTDIVLPINADSSQLEAIYEAVNDKTYILHGPPGTGKSQTITNIIANALYKGKRVLFVAEKMAALSVVQSRLAAIGLAPFCLELHSNKTKKSAILAQLKTTTEVLKHSAPEDFEQEAARLHKLRNEMNVYIDTLHKKYPFGLSIYDAIARYLSISNDTEFTMPQELLDGLTKETILEWNDAVELMVSTGRAFGHPYNHPLTGIEISGYSSTVKDEATKLISDTIGLLSDIKSKLNVLARLLGDANANYDKYQIDIISGIVSKLLQIPELTPTLLQQPRINEVLDDYKEVVVHGKERDKIKGEITTKFMDEILSIEARIKLNEWNQASNKWFIPKFFGQRKIKKQLKPYALSSSIATEDVKGILVQTIKYQEEEKYVSQYNDRTPSLFGKYGKKSNEDWNAISQIISDSESLNALILNYAKDISNTARIKEAIAGQLSEGIDSFRSIHGNSLTEISKLLSDLSVAENKLHTTLGVDKGYLYDDSVYWTDTALSRLNLWLTNIDKLKDWYQWLQACEKLDGLNIGFIADEYKNRNIPTDAVMNAFHKGFYHTCTDYIIAREPGLELFKGKLFNDVIKKYKELTVNFEELTKKELYAKLATNIPSFTKEAAQNSEVGILQRNIKNNGRGTSIRKLFDQIPTLLSRMCPCMLMSPISVAQYIDPDADKFDLIVFDEASQMPTYEAIGAIARGKNVVIVGDPKQMPPTSFFAVNTVDEENIDMEDLESILDDCLALSMPSKYLLWHYRSKHESLIAFSNSEYYNNKLLTFPSPDNIESKVKLVQIDGFYDKGKSRQNKAEAQAVIDEIARRLSDDNLRKRSIGVVTFSSVQQTLIEDLLSDLFVLRPDLETIALESEEPLFIKNLENVQGDERDIILFSVGYGPDANGRVSMNFGPLNRLGGERRLNVAVSRARYEMIIYSTLRPDQIDLNRSSAVGVAGLKRFLEYAQRGERITIDTQTTTDTTISIENVIAKELRKAGYTVHTDIGCSGYKIDIGIVDEKNPSNYILGILCDGENYKQTKTARDREIVQNGVLKLLGWNICRIWTMDWWEKPEEVMETISEAIRTVKENEAKKPQEIKYKPAVTQPGDTVIKDIPATPTKKSDGSEQPYRFVTLKQVSYPAEDFFRTEHNSLIQQQIKQIMSSEAPLSRSLLYKKILSTWNISRLGQRLETHLDMIISELPFFKTQHDGTVFYWLNEEQYKSFDTYRTMSERDAADLPPEEVANAVRQILTDQISLPAKDLLRITAQLFGFARSGTNVDIAINKGIVEAERKGFIKANGDRIVIA